MLCKVCFKWPYQGLSVLSINTGPQANMEMQQLTMSLLTIVQPRHFDWLTPGDNPAQFDVSSFVHAAVLQRLYEDGWIQAFAWGEVKRPWIWRRGEERGEESHTGNKSNTCNYITAHSLFLILAHCPLMSVFTIYLYIFCVLHPFTHQTIFTLIIWGVVLREESTSVLEISPAIGAISVFKAAHLPKQFAPHLFSSRFLFFLPFSDLHNTSERYLKKTCLVLNTQYVISASRDLSMKTNNQNCQWKAIACDSGRSVNGRGDVSRFYPCYR